MIWVIPGKRWKAVKYCFGTLMALDWDTIDNAYLNVRDHYNGRLNALPGITVTWDGNTPLSMKEDYEDRKLGCGMEPISDLL